MLSDARPVTLARLTALADCIGWVAVSVDWFEALAFFGAFIIDPKLVGTVILGAECTFGSGSRGTVEL